MTMFTWLEIDSQAIKHNLKQFRRLIGDKCLLMPVIKANAYGHGFLGVAKICQKSREVDRVCVVNSEEALELIHRGFKKPIMILSFFDFDEKKLLKLAKKRVIFPLFLLKQAKILNRVGERLKKTVKVHLKIDTGAARVGVLPVELGEFAHALKKLKYLDIEGVFSHYASSEEDQAYTKQQLRVFKQALEILREQGIDPPLKHFSCSAAALLFPAGNFNAIRLGIGLYGLYPSDETKKKITLRPALSWFTTVIQVKTMPAGAKIGYGGTYTAPRRTKIVVLPVGYWDGWDRRFSNNAQVIIKGRKYPLVGRVCMNLSMADVSGADVKEGDKVTLIGQDGRAKITADDLAARAGTINYEIVDRINPLLPRIFT